jgi:adenylosuccinate lyase
MKNNNNLVSKLSEKQLIEENVRMDSICPDDAKYRTKSDPLRPYLSFDAEWKGCGEVQRALLETRVEYNQAKSNDLILFDKAFKNFNSINASLIEELLTHHDQLAVIEEFGRFMPEKLKSLLHPGTTSYDILDTARSWLFKSAWNDVMKPVIQQAISKLCNISENSMDYLQVGRTHLQDTSPIIFGANMAGYARRFSDRLIKCDENFNSLKGKISGIVGTGASIDMVIGENLSEEFELDVLSKLNLVPDYAASQIVQKEILSDAGHSLTTMMLVLKDFANDIRLLYSSAIGEVTSRDNAKRLGGSSADAMKNNPINYENIKGKAKVVESGMSLLYELIASDLQRDLSGSVVARYQPQLMMSQTYESFLRLNKALGNLSINEDRLKENLVPVQKNPSEAMVAILRGEQWVHSKYGVGHDFVKNYGKIAKTNKLHLIDVCLDDPEFKLLYDKISDNKKEILNGNFKKYTGHSVQRAKRNINYSREIIK